MSCPNCGGSMIGDGHESVRHCENVISELMDLEPDAGPIYCEASENVEEMPFSDEYRATVTVAARDRDRPSIQTDRAFLVDYDDLDISVIAPEAWSTRMMNILRKVRTYVVCK